MPSPAATWQLPLLLMQACVRRDERALRTFIQQYIQLPLPGSGDRHSMLRAFARVGLLPWVRLPLQGLLVCWAVCCAAPCELHFPLQQAVQAITHDPGPSAHSSTTTIACRRQGWRWERRRLCWPSSQKGSAQGSSES